MPVEAASVELAAGIEAALDARVDGWIMLIERLIGTCIVLC